MEDEFIEDDFLEEDEGSSSSSRPFLVAVGALVTVFILAAVCTFGILMTRNRSAGNSAEVAAIETQNAITIVTNTAVAQFIAETETAQAMPTETPELPPTNTSTPPPATEVPDATETPVIDSAEGESAAGGDGDGAADGSSDGAGEAGEEGADGEMVDGAEGTIVIGDGSGNGADGSTDSTADNGSRGETDSSGSAIVGGAGATAIPATDAQKGTLPQTGLETWGIALIGLLLVAVLFAAHRLRTN